MKKSNYTDEDIVSAYNRGLYLRNIEKLYHIDIRTIKKILSNNNIFYIPKIGRKHQINEYFFDNIDSEEKAYFLGFLFADGAVSNNLYNVRLTLKSGDVDIIKKLDKCIYIDTTKDHVTIRKSKQLENKYYASLDINSSHLVKSLIKHGCTPKKSLTLKFPQIDPTLQHHFIRGYFDGDGGLNVKSKTFVITSTYNFCKSAIEIIKNNVDANLHIYKYKNIYRLTSHGRNQVLKILAYLYRDSKFYLDRKYELYKNLLNEPTNYYSNEEKENFLQLYTEGNSFDRISKLTVRSSNGIKKFITNNILQKII